MGSRTSPQDANVEKLISWTTIKKETPDNEIKEFAETAMNELLGWYGYDKMPRDDPAILQGLPSAVATPTRMSTRSRKQPSESPTPTSDADSSDDEEEVSITRAPSESSKHGTGDKLVKCERCCGWCNKTLPQDECQVLTSSSGSFCSELCFSQSRRASFKKNKTCDWCRHVRHTVSYVDFQDGASQLQFCSDKCLNQYKMHIFCREAQAHLELHPHLHVPNADSSVQQQGLITPELWLRNCRSPSNELLSPSPGYSPTPPLPPPPLHADVGKQPPQQTSPLPLITVAHPSKLMSYPEKVEDLRVDRKTKHKRRRNSNCSATVTSSLKDSPTHVQDLRMQPNTTPPMRSKLSDVTPLPAAAAPLPPPPPPPPAPASAPPPPQPENLSSGKHFMPPPPPNFFFGPRHPHMFAGEPRLFPPNLFPPTFLPPTPPRVPFPQLLPPVTVLVPYPVILPIPLPIPLPVPLAEFLRAASAAVAKEAAAAAAAAATAAGTAATDDTKPSAPDTSAVNAAAGTDTDRSAGSSSTTTTTTTHSDVTELDAEEATTSDEPHPDSLPTPLRPLRKRKRVLSKENSKEINCKTRKIKYLSV